QAHRARVGVDFHSRRSGERGIQEGVRSTTKLIALKVEQRFGYGVNGNRNRGATIGVRGGRRGRRSAEDVDKVGRRPVVGDDRQAGVADLRARGQRAALPCTLVVEEKESESLAANRAANTSTEDILLHRGPG